MSEQVNPEQTEMPFAFVQGEPMTTLPKDLYIPPDALEVFLDAFEGPLDLLLYLIKRQNLDILEIPIAEITFQYMEYVEIMKELKLELAAEYLVMAAMLAEIKSRMLLPRNVEEDEEDDPRAELIRRLQEYERYKQASEELDALPRLRRELFQIEVDVGGRIVEKCSPQVDVRDVLMALKDVISRADLFSRHRIELEPLSVRERMSAILERINAENFLDFTSFFKIEEGRLGVVVTFLAILELIKVALIEIVQSEPFAPIHIKRVSVAESDQPQTSV